MQLFWKEKKCQMISLINSDLAKGRGKTPNKQTNKQKPQTIVYCR